MLFQEEPKKEFKQWVPKLPTVHTKEDEEEKTSEEPKEVRRRLKRSREQLHVQGYVDKNFIGLFKFAS